MKRLFISYRRDDTAGHAGRLFDFLSERLGVDSVFMDVDGIEPGVDFVVALEKALAGSEVVLAVIGRNWASIADRDGHRRLDDPNDFVRLELASALKKSGVRVVPVLVQDAQMPRTEQLPDDLKPLARRNAVEISDTRWGRDCEDLLRGLLPKGSGAGRGNAAAQGAAGAEGGAAAEGRGKPTDAGGGRRRNAGLWAALAGIVAVAGGVGWYAIGGGAGGGSGAAPKEGPLPSADARPSDTAGGGAGGALKQVEVPTVVGSSSGDSSVVAGPGAAPKVGPAHPDDPGTSRTAGDGAGGASTQVKVPKVVGSSRGETMKALAAAGLTISDVQFGDSSVAERDRVIAQDPPAGSKVDRGTSVALTLGAGGPPGVHAWVSPRTMPDFVKTPLWDVRASLDAHWLLLDGVEHRVDDTLAPGTVIAQRPPAGSHVTFGSSVRLVVARKPAEQITAAGKPAGHDVATVFVGESGSRQVALADHAFGTVFVGESRSRQVALANRGKTALTVGPIRVSGDADAFDVGGGAPCDGRVLRMGERCAFEVRFAPTAAGRQSASVEFTATNGARFALLKLGGDGRVPMPPHVAGLSCKQGWVWREAFEGDYVCVTAQVRSQVAADNAQRAARIDPVNRANGPATCRQGFVWRVADSFMRPNAADLVCVTAEQRAQAAADNEAHESRWQLGLRPVNPAALEQVDKLVLPPKN